MMAVTRAAEQMDVKQAQSPALESFPMDRLSGSSWHRIRIIAAIIFAAACILYSAIWMYYIRLGPPGTQLGASLSQPDRGAYPEVTKVDPQSPAGKDGLRQGDRILSVNGRALYSVEPLLTARMLAKPGDSIVLTVQRPGSHKVEEIRTALEATPPPSPRRLNHRIIDQILTSFPLLFLAVGLPVLFLRVDSRDAWLLAITFASFIATAPMALMTGLMRAGLSAFSLFFMFLFQGIGASTFAYLFATFPARSPIDLRLPWLKNLILGAALAVSLPLAIACLLARRLDPLWPFFYWLLGISFILPVVEIYYFGAYGLGIVSLIWNTFRAPTLDARRRTRVMVWGTVLAQLPWIVCQLIAIYEHTNIYELPFWAWSSAVIAEFLMPISFAYAVLKHRVLDVPVLLRRSARYLVVQRGFLILIVVVGFVATGGLARSFSRHFPTSSRQAIPVGVAFGMALIGGGSWVQQRVNRQLDKAFFRTSYDTREILENLVEKTREVRTRTQLSELLESNLRLAMQPTFVMVYLLLGDGTTGEVDTTPEAHVVSLDDAFLDDLFAEGRPLEITPDNKAPDLGQIRPEVLVPICGRERQKLGLLVLGPRKSDEPYSREDKRLLALIASQAGSTLENIKLAEDIAERMEVERRAAHEINLARQVQRKLFPQNPPRVPNLDYAGNCVQARVVGGDYYDFFELSKGLLGITLADISGKGFPAALLMANLQANLRGQYALAADDLPRLLQSVNRLFYENTEPSHYATMFFGCYDGLRRTLRYVNCGHNPPLVLRAEGAIVRLHATATVMGLFCEWQCSVSEIAMGTGDLFVLYTDGITEAADEHGEEFGEQRLIEAARQCCKLSASDLLGALLTAVQQFSAGEQGDDMTAVVGKVL